MRVSLLKRNALTLIELLVVIVIMLLLVTVVLPLAQPNSNERLVREASRQVNAFFATVQSRAVAEGRPYGVILARGADGPCYDLSMARVPGLYSGDESNSIAVVEVGDGDTRRTLTGVNTILNSVSNDDTSRFVDAGDQIRFGYRGPWYVIQDTDSDGVAVQVSSADPMRVVVEFDIGGSSPAIYPPLTELGAVDKGLPFQIRRMPRTQSVARTSAPSLTLPVGAYIDMNVSGVGTDGLLPDGPVTIMVDKQGRLASLLGNGFSTQIDDSLFLLIGSAKPITGAAHVQTWLDQVKNLTPDSGSVWVTLGNVSGRMMTVQNLGVQFQVNGTAANVQDPDGSTNNYNLGEKDIMTQSGEWYSARNDVVTYARSTAITGPSMGGR